MAETDDRPEYDVYRGGVCLGQVRVRARTNFGRFRDSVLRRLGLADLCGYCSVHACAPGCKLPRSDKLLHTVSDLEKTRLAVWCNCAVDEFYGNALVVICFFDPDQPDVVCARR